MISTVERNSYGYLNAKRLDFKLIPNVTLKTVYFKKSRMKSPLKNAHIQAPMNHRIFQMHIDFLRFERPSTSVSTEFSLLQVEAFSFILEAFRFSAIQWDSKRHENFNQKI
jgi:hypothetical protein